MKLTSKQKKLLWIVAAVCVVIRFAPPAILAVRQAIAARQQAAARAVQKPSPARPVLGLANTPSTAFAFPDLRFRRLLGSWLGGGLIPNRGICRLGIELKINPDKPGFYSGYSTLTCGPSLPFNGQKPTQQNQTASLINQMSPVSTILTGQAVNGSLQFHVDQQIGAAPDGCPVTGFTITPFGDNNVAAVWQEGTCPGGNMILKRMANGY